MAKQKRNLPGPYMLKKMQKQVPGFAVFDAGLSVHPSFPYLLASPDGKVFDPSTDSKYGLLEIKCPFSKRGETLDQAAADPNFYLEKVGGKSHLKKEHNCGHYAQVQGQLALTGLKWCDFCQIQMKCVLTGFILIQTTGKISSCQNCHSCICVMRCSDCLKTDYGKITKLMTSMLLNVNTDQCETQPINQSMQISINVINL